MGSITYVKVLMFNVRINEKNFIHMEGLEWRINNHPKT